MTYWAVALCKSGSENVAVDNLQRQGFVSYIPKYLQRVGKVTKVKILFPRYIFVQIEEQWHSINSTRGVSRLILTNENKPAVIQDEVIEELKSREDSKGLIQLPSQGRFRQGENVTIANGVLEGYNGIYEGMRDADRVRVLIDLLGRKVLIEVNEQDLKTAVASK